MLYVHITFTGLNGPTASDIRALRAASATVARYPLGEVIAALRRVRNVVLELDEPASESVELLESRGLRPVRVHSQATGYGADWLFRELECAPIREGEHRWTFMSSYTPEIVVSATPAGDAWQVEIRRPRESLWYASQLEVWPDTAQEIPERSAPERLPLAAPRPPRERPPVDIETATASPRASAEATKALARMHAAPQTQPPVPCSGVRVELHWMTSGLESRLTTHGEPGDQRGWCLREAGLTFARSAAASDALRAAVEALAKY